MKAAALLAALTLAVGCSDARRPAAMTDAVLSSELKRCRELAMEAYQDPRWRAAQAEQSGRFLGRDRGRR